MADKAEWGCEIELVASAKHYPLHTRDRKPAPLEGVVRRAPFAEQRAESAEREKSAETWIFAMTATFAQIAGTAPTVAFRAGKKRPERTSGLVFLVVERLPGTNLRSNPEGHTSPIWQHIQTFYADCRGASAMLLVANSTYCYQPSNCLGLEFDCRLRDRTAGKSALI